MLPMLLVVVAVVLIGIAAWQFQRFTDRHREARTAEHLNQFHRRREWLEAKFFDVAAQRGSPRGLKWSEIDFDNAVVFARDRRDGQLAALVGVSIQFEAIEGGGMEDVEAVANRKAASAVFRHRGTEWTTEGRAIFNLTPSEAIEYYQSELERLETDRPKRVAISD